MAYRSKKLRRKVSPWTIMTIAIVVVALVGITLLLQPTKKRKIYNQFQNYELPKEEHVFEELSFKKLMKKLENNEDLILFLGSPLDNNSRIEIAEYNNEFNKQNVSEVIDKVYYLNVSKLKEDQIKILKEDYKLNVDSIPELVYFNNDEVVFNKNKYQGETNLKKVKDFYLDVIKEKKAQ